MPKLRNSVPKYRRHKASGQAVVTLDGKDFYLGPHNSKVSIAEDYYREPDGNSSKELDAYRQAMKPLRRLYGHSCVNDFGPLTVKAIHSVEVFIILCSYLK